MAQSVVISRISTTEKVIALTFDGGSDFTNAQSILNILKDKGIKSTFFITGQSAEKNPTLTKLVLQNGHEIGDHSYSHPHMTTLSTSSMITEIQRSEDSLYNVTGRFPIRLFRPPYGNYNSTVLSAVGAAGYPWTIMWTIDTLDWDGVSTDAIVQKVLINAKPGAIVLMHLGGGTHTPEALPTVISELKNMGYRFIRMSEVLSIPQIPPHPLVKRGSTGADVVFLQLSLTKLGYSPGAADGIFGPRTEQAVKLFQSHKGLVVDGIVGPKTWTALEIALHSPSTTPPPASHPLLKRGSTGSEVRYLQESLIKLGYTPGPVDGIFGPLTEGAVKKFQADHGLVVDGIVGPKTWAALDNAL